MMSSSEIEPAIDGKLKYNTDEHDVYLETYIQESGGCGRYQILLALTIHSMKSVINFSMLFFMFGAAVPDWWCMDGLHDNNSTLIANTQQYKSCHVGNSTGTCKAFRFDDSMRTIVSEWNLVCDQEWIPFLLTSLQMAGLLFGNLVCGQLADLFGRKPPFLVSFIIMLAAHGAVAFVTSWKIGAVFWFTIGVTCGFFLTLQYSIMVEYSLIRWRTWLVVMPSWEIESMLFALIAWLAKDWRYIHITTAVVGIPLLVTYCIIGVESFRWYVSHDRLDDARNVIKRVAKINKSSTPMVSVEKRIAEKSKDRKYTFLDLFRNRTLLIYTVVFFVIWLNLGLSTYGLQFGVSSLTGNLYINIFLIGLVGAPLRFVSLFLLNRIGRKNTASIFNIISIITAFAVAIEYRFEEI